MDIKYHWFKRHEFLSWRTSLLLAGGGCAIKAILYLQIFSLFINTYIYRYLVYLSILILIDLLVFSCKQTRAKPGPALQIPW